MCINKFVSNIDILRTRNLFKDNPNVDLYLFYDKEKTEYYF